MIPNPSTGVPLTEAQERRFLALIKLLADCHEPHADNDPCVDCRRVVPLAFDIVLNGAHTITFNPFRISQ